MINVTRSLQVEGDRFNLKNISKDSYSKGINFSIVLDKGETKEMPLTGMSVIKSIDIVADGKIGISVGDLIVTGDSFSRSGHSLFSDKMILTNKGRNIETIEILDVQEDDVLNSSLPPDSVESYYALTINNVSYEQGVYETRKVEGSYKSYEGESFYISESNRSEAKITLTGIGQYDELGQKYVYDPSNDDMEVRFEENGITYGSFKVVRGEIFAQALQRCINAQMGNGYCGVSFVNSSFKIIINRDNCTSFVIRDNPPSYVATKTGLTSGAFTPSDETLSGRQLCVGDRLYPVMSSKGNKVVIKDSGNSIPQTGNQIASISQFAANGGDFGSMCTDVHCNETGTYRVYPNLNSPEMFSKVRMIQGILYQMPCWKILNSDGSVLDSEALTIFWDRTFPYISDSELVEWPNGFLSPRYVDVVTPGAVGVTAFIYGE